jgi:uncharacterized protein YndB with AHSA1/START domain
MGALTDMAYTSRTLRAPVDVVWEVLIDPHTYPHWLIGAAAIRDLDDDWPAIGSRFHHRVGIGWLSIPDHSEVESVVDTDLLQLTVRARPLVSATATFRLVGVGNTTVITLEEEPRVRSIGNLVRPLLDPVVHVRNHRALRRLERVVDDRVNSAYRV